MDKAERGALFVDQEEAQKAIACLRHEIREIADIFLKLSNHLRTHPVSVTFKNAPRSLGLTSELSMELSELDWQLIPDKETLAQKLIELKNQEANLKEIQRKLRA
jgi:hypothetical protein